MLKSQHSKNEKKKPQNPTKHMKKQGNMAQSKEQNKTPEEQPFRKAELRAAYHGVLNNCDKVLSELQENTNGN